MKTRQAKFNNISHCYKFAGWNYCVSTSSSYMSLSWVEHFFSTKEEASAFEKEARNAGYVTLTVTPNEY